MKMRLIICLIAFVLSCNVTAAAIIHVVVEEENPVSLRCPHPVEGKVTWSRETNGNRVDILTADDEGDIKHIHDPGRRYGSLKDKFKSLVILGANPSDAGRYLCNDEPAVELNVIPTGTVRLTAAEGNSVTLKCPPDVGGSAVPTWSREIGEIQQQSRFRVSPVDKTLTIRKVKPGDSGLYYCDGKPAAYLTVTKGKEEPPTTAPLTTPANTDTTTRKGPVKKPGKKKKGERRKTFATERNSTRTSSTPTLTSETNPGKEEPPTTAPLTTPANTDTTKKGPVKKPGKKKKGEKRKTSARTSSTPTLTSETNPAASYLWLSVRMGIVMLCLIIMISITVTAWRKGS